MQWDIMHCKLPMEGSYTEIIPSFRPLSRSPACPFREAHWVLHPALCDPGLPPHFFPGLPTHSALPSIHASAGMLASGHPSLEIEENVRKINVSNNCCLYFY